MTKQPDTDKTAISSFVILNAQKAHITDQGYVLQNQPQMGH